MQSPIKKFFLASAVVAMAAMSTGFAHAEKSFSVPFDFTVGNKQCAAGNYTVVQNGINAVVTLKSSQSPQMFAWVLMPGDPAPNDSRVVLTFDKIGAGYALRTVQYGALITTELDTRARRLEYARTHTPVVETRIAMGQ